jgi:ADP-ribose pyrophosphatase
LNLFDVAYVDTAGHGRSWQIASRSTLPKCISGNYAVPDAVIIVPFHTVENKLVITREYRVPLADYEYGFPAGLIDAAESIEETARRELQEETGLRLTRFLRISPPIYSSAGMTDESIAMVYAECEGQPSTAENKGSELIEVQLVNRTQANELCKNYNLKFDAKAWLVLSQFAEKGNIE